MSLKLLKKENWPDLIEKLRDKNLWVPDASNEAFSFVPLAAGETPDLDYCNTRVPPKNMLFPQTETMYRFQLGGTEIKLPPIGEELVVLGLRPCDGRAASILNKMFDDNIKDPYYAKRMEQVTFVGLACNTPDLNCFCTSVGGGPASTEGLDLLMVDLGENYLFEVVSPKGEALLEGLPELFVEADEKALAAKAEAESKAAEKINRFVDTEGVAQGLPTLWDDALWQNISAACLGCGTCTFLCPTCHCFDIQDETEGFSSRRCRMWDSCMFEEYTLHTSGHNPRPSRRERTRNRINHKYSYYVDNFDVIACVGCGRCINLCPVNIDIVEILRQVKEAL